MHVVLVEPEIAPNTGNVARLCGATHTRLHLIEPLGFKLDDQRLRRAGMDYWKYVHWQRWPNWQTFTEALPRDAQLWFIEQGGRQRYDEVQYSSGDYLVFGRESAGLPHNLLQANAKQWVRIPMLNADTRSLNLSNCVALVVYEALRQQGFHEAYRRVSKAPGDV